MNIVLHPPGRGAVQFRCQPRAARSGSTQPPDARRLRRSGGRSGRPVALPANRQPV